MLEAILTRTGPDKTEAVTAAGAVASDLAQHILSRLTPGAHLPSEAELAARYAVSRLTIREAVKLLEGRGLIEIARGRKATVREPDGTAFTDFLATIVHNDAKGVFDLVEVRLSLEVQSATLAAKRANRAGIAAIENALERMRAAARRAAAGEDSAACERDFNHADVGFHEAVALSSGNRILSYLFEAMAGPLEEGFFISRRGSLARGQTLDATIEAHQRVLDAIRDGNGRAAGEAMRNHLKDTMRDIRVAVGELGGSRTPPA
ncbi:FadR/GntR family transcriptional regulator [Devosia geojensis]|uniref:FadR/GntR family transcriptional regulator n=1 Tax=Devosia geojensis TaxID=443610 RepID=UPI000696045B|nr:FadR/GntR family transcriptional regulator [Devosia geojensis]